MKKTLVSVAATAVLSSSFVSYAAASTHKVESGDSLWLIATKYDTTIANLKSLNKLHSEMIFPNQVLKVAANGSQPPKASKPTKQTTGQTSANTYTIKSGDTLGQIAATHSITLNDLMSWNGLRNHLIYPGQVLKVSKAGTTTAPSKPAAPSPEKPAQDAHTSSYSVKSGDTLSHIGIKFGVTVAELKKLNGLSSDFLFIGQVLKVSNSGSQTAPAKPAPAPAKPQQNHSVTTYTVKSGDTLSYIGAAFGVSVSELKSLNGLSSDFLRVGQVLKVKGTKGTAQDVKPPASSSSSTFSVNKLLSEATSHIGTPYVWGGSSVGGFDCSGFIYYVFKEAGAKDVKRLSSEGYYSRSYYVNSPQPGDIVFFENTYKKGISHLGIYVGNNEFIHAGDNGVEISSLSNSYWKSKFDGFKRFYEL
ncbi:LysM peptidoglycan-binding domain-containing protein [Rossellomorea vietnamensis]|uniref:LysM peptidoglycan-binding domain-containing protein n=1 Tax=Rossellomorea vietnamensis TaxID=218284 RepID=A0ACD4C3G3_9BACI|nr:peptidoglycan endopeptidase [Rossellomorea vietnamensis]UXH43184.1 LysM peptidoglycan-binding domain-containing protein [Rossellomorea vietnamensis]